MSDINEHNLNEKEVPFFARYLEGQGVEEFAEDLSEEELKSVRGGCGPVTLKYPSDNEDGSGGGAVTMKYPSDNDEIF